LNEIWEKLSQNLGANLIRFEQNQNLASPKTSRLFRPCQKL